MSWQPLVAEHEAPVRMMVMEDVVLEAVVEHSQQSLTSPPPWGRKRVDLTGPARTASSWTAPVPCMWGRRVQPGARPAYRIRRTRERRTCARDSGDALHGGRAQGGGTAATGSSGEYDITFDGLICRCRFGRKDDSGKESVLVLSLTSDHAEDSSTSGSKKT